MHIINAIMTAVSLATFLGIVWWAYSRGRQRANHESAMLPFALPDEDTLAPEGARP
ncbi:MAG TPA: CcoQ/FixQ family Cbb3-type cytochrome c oxidase assembly chaperone [Bordetella sp.]|nr:CcoQ/FixQ family Cbb3-type cytochrome c oxidase assembly chaperone [Bordetella sp.]